MKLNQICKFMIFLIVIIVKPENAGRCMYGSDDRNKWHVKQDSQLLLSWGRPHPLRPRDVNDDKGSTLSLQLRGWLKKLYRKNDERQNKACQIGKEKKRQSKLLLLVRLWKEKIRRNEIR